MKRFDWEDFRHFAALAQTLHLGRAAVQLKTSQVTVMRRVKALEQSLGVTLFIRRRDGHRLSPAGRKLVASAQDARSVMDRVAALIGPGDSTDGHVRIATTEIGANWLLLPSLGHFRRAHPDIALEIDASPNALDLLEDTETIALRFQLPAAGDYVVKRLGAVPHGLYGTASVCRALKGVSGTEFLRQAPFIGWAGAFSDIGPARWLRSMFGNRQPGLACTTFHGHLEACRAGHGVAALPDFVAGQFSDLERWPVSVSPFALEAWMVIPSQVRHAARIKATARFVEGAVVRSLSGR